MPKFMHCMELLFFFLFFLGVFCFIFLPGFALLYLFLNILLIVVEFLFA